jgi:hypothetical protein
LFIFIYLFQEKSREEKEKYKRLFREKLESCEWATLYCPWRKVKESFREEEWFAKLEPVECLRVFEAHIRNLEKEDYQNFSNERAALAKCSRLAREKYRVCNFIHFNSNGFFNINFFSKALLAERHQAGEINCRTSWKQFCEANLENPIYQEMLVVEG